MYLCSYTNRALSTKTLFKKFESQAWRFCGPLAFFCSSVVLFSSSSTSSASACSSKTTVCLNMHPCALILTIQVESISNSREYFLLLQSAEHSSVGATSSVLIEFLLIYWLHWILKITVGHTIYRATDTILFKKKKKKQRKTKQSLTSVAYSLFLVFPRTKCFVFALKLLWHLNQPL